MENKNKEMGNKGTTKNIEKYLSDYDYELDKNVKKELWNKIYKDVPYLKTVPFLPKL